MKKTIKKIFIAMCLITMTAACEDEFFSEQVRVLQVQDKG